VDASLLTKEEISWINKYHADVKEKVLPVLEKFGDDLAVKWLVRECGQI
jgi:Xaa-Pro aminopeptidase